MLAHKYWHFVNTPYIPGSKKAAKAPGPNAELQIDYFSQDLSTAASDPIKSYDLVWLEHLVGDLHQPLHATTRILGGKSDLGGLDVKVSGGAGELHAYWDELPGKANFSQPADDYTTAMSFVATLKPAPAVQAADLTVADWTAESFAMAKSAVYVAPIGPALGPYTITPPPSAYAVHALADARARIELAGERLAHLIDADLK